jgi:hypothetical protein
MKHLSDILRLAAAEQPFWGDRLARVLASGDPTNADTATFSGAMKTRFIGPIRDTMHKGRVLLWGSGGETGAGTPEGFKGILPSAEDISFVGNEFRIPFKTKRNQAVGFRSENELLMAPGASGYTYLTEPLRYAYGLFNITGQLMKAAEVGEGAFKAAFRSEMDDTVLTSQLDFNRAAWGDGSGKMATVRTTTAAGQSVIPVDTTINFRGGEIIDFVQAAANVVSNAGRLHRSGGGSHEPHHHGEPGAGHRRRHCEHGLPRPREHRFHGRGAEQLLQQGNPGHPVHRDRHRHASRHEPGDGPVLEELRQEHRWRDQLTP